MFSQREDGDSKHSPAFCKGVGVLNRSSRRRGTSNRVRRSLSKFGFSEPPLTVRPWSHNQSDSTRSCARQETPSHTKRFVRCPYWILMRPCCKGLQPNRPQCCHQRIWPK
ncbi:hypothetical protein AAHE18_14G095100 [Arachis hypogaea]